MCPAPKEIYAPPVKPYPLLQLGLLSFLAVGRIEVVTIQMAIDPTLEAMAETAMLMGKKGTEMAQIVAEVATADNHCFWEAVSNC